MKHLSVSNVFFGLTIVMFVVSVLSGAFIPSLALFISGCMAGYGKLSLKEAKKLDNANKKMLL